MMSYISKGLGIRATGRVLEKSGTSIINGEKRLSEEVLSWSPCAPVESEVTLEGDEVYTCVGENLPPPQPPKGGRFTSLSGLVAIESRPNSDLKMHPSLRRESKQPGIGRNPGNGFYRRRTTVWQGIVETNQCVSNPR
jgi:hypothetical protein